MKKIHTLGLAFVALLAFSAFAAATAGAEITLLAEWLVDGVGVTELTSVQTTGLIILVNKTILGTSFIHCEISFDGTVGPNGEDEFIEGLDTGGVAAGVPLTGHFLDCFVVEAAGPCGAVGALVEVWPENLQWLSNLFLMEDGTILNHFYEGTPAGTFPAFDVHCSSTNTDNLCEGLASALMENMPLENDVLELFIRGSETATCSIGTMELEGEFSVTTLDGLTLAVSSV